MNMLNKRGQGLSMTTIVVIILAVLVLLVIAIIFLGGTTSLTQKITDFFNPQEAMSVDIAIQNCVTWCEQAQLLPEDQQDSSSYCSATQDNVDISRDGEIDDDEKEFFCDLGNANLANLRDIAGSLGVSCDVDCQ